MAMHRYDKYRGKAKNCKNVLRYSDATKWMDEQAGPWEIARVSAPSSDETQNLRLKILVMISNCSKTRTKLH